MGGGARVNVVTPRALLAADCGSGVGLGHLERMLALADALQTDFDVAVVIPEGDEPLRRRVMERGHIALGQPGDSSQRVEAAVAADASVQVAVLDGYVFDVQLQHRLRSRANLAVVDDLGLPADCDLGVNPSPGGEHLRPATVDRFLGGAAFALLRASFLEARELVISRGASTADRARLHRCDRPRRHRRRSHRRVARVDGTVDVVRVVGPDTDAGVPPAHAREHRLVAPLTLAGALSGATVYAGAAGTTAIQAACLGIPAVITAVVPNQEAQAAALAAGGCAVVTDATGLARACLQLLDDPERCDVMAVHGRALVDGRGAARVAEAVRNLAASRAA